jgi:hypothetical protein
VTKEWQQKLPDFVRRLEEALYRSATTKARGAAVPAASCAHWVACCALACLGDARAALRARSCGECTDCEKPGPQEEYMQVETLEQRLQAVARRMVARPSSAGGGGDGGGAAAFGLASGVQGLAPLGTPGAAGAHGGLGGSGAAGGLFLKAENGYLDTVAGGAAGGGGGLGFPAGEGPGQLHLHLGAGAGQLAGLGGAAGGLKLEGDALASPAAGALGGVGGLGAAMGPSGQLAGPGVVLRGAPAGGYAGLVRASDPQRRVWRASGPPRRSRARSRRLFSVDPGPSRAALRGRKIAPHAPAARF